ncbi:hypothetical protein BKA57DRAFT_469680 [Linnemannia elongata]|nr:hypothetical protein BKA57DRAFT_469680 [Linnemannia elongata]
MQDKRIIVLVSLALLVASALADMTPREKWVRWGIDECNGDPNCWKELFFYLDEKLDRRFCENEDRPEMIFFRDRLTRTGSATSSQSHPPMPSSYVDTHKGAPRSTSEL